MNEHPSQVVTLNDLAQKICNTGDAEDKSGNPVSPKIIILDHYGKEYYIDDIWLRGDNKLVINLEAK